MRRWRRILGFYSAFLQHGPLAPFNSDRTRSRFTSTARRCTSASSSRPHWSGGQKSRFIYWSKWLDSLAGAPFLARSRKTLVCGRCAERPAERARCHKPAVVAARVGAASPVKGCWFSGDYFKSYHIKYFNTN
jgi:hypothetical protein